VRQGLERGPVRRRQAVGEHGRIEGSGHCTCDSVSRILVVSREQQGKVFSAVFSPDDPLTIAAAGSKARLQIWDVGANLGARKAFASKLSEAGKVLKEKKGAGVVGVVSDDDEIDSGGEEDES
jgi:periodic tryptophan protein 1